MNAVRSSNREKAENNRRTNKNQIENTHNKQRTTMQANKHRTNRDTVGVGTVANANFVTHLSVVYRTRM